MIQTLLQLCDLALHCVQQYRWGASAVKPTGLLAWSLPFFRKDMYSFALAIGKHEASNFCTSKHKEYPPMFCKALAFVVVQQFDRFLRGGGRRRVRPLRRLWTSGLHRRRLPLQLLEMIAIGCQIFNASKFENVHGSKGYPFDAGNVNGKLFILFCMHPYLGY